MLGWFVMDHHTSGQPSQPSHATNFQWLSFAYQGLTEIPYETILTQTDTLEVLDLSYNLLEEYPFLNSQKLDDKLQEPLTALYPVLVPRTEVIENRRKN